MRLAMIGVTVGVMVLAGCDGTAEPAQPPSQEDALTTATATPPPPPPIDETEATTDAAPTTIAPTGDTVGTTEDAGGPPELPEEATEQTEEGAEAFVEHYLLQLNATGQEPQAGILEQYASDSCGTCAQFATAVTDMLEENEHYDAPLTQLQDVNTIYTGDTAISIATVNQPDVNVISQTGEVVNTYPAERGVRMEFHLRWDRAWTIDKIFLVEN